MSPGYLVCLLYAVTRLLILFPIRVHSLSLSPSTLCGVCLSSAPETYFNVTMRERERQRERDRERQTDRQKQRETPTSFVRRSFYFTSLSLEGNFGSLIWLRRSSLRSSASHSCRCVQCFRVYKQWYGCQCLGFLTSTQTLMHAVAHCIGN